MAREGLNLSGSCLIMGLQGIKGLQTMLVICAGRLCTLVTEKDYQHI